MDSTKSSSTGPRTQTADPELRCPSIWSRRRELPHVAAAERESQTPIGMLALDSTGSTGRTGPHQGSWTVEMTSWFASCQN